MKLEDGIKLQGCPAEIPDCNRNDLPLFLKETGRLIGAEIGVDHGEYTEEFCKSGLKIFAIDPWLYYKDYLRSQEGMDLICKDAEKRLKPYPNCTIIRKTSMDALSEVEDESLDFVYIDGNHWFKYVAEDLVEWTKKVKKGGIVAGHDYFLSTSTSNVGTCHVRFIVDAFVRAYRIKNFFVLGTKISEEGEKRDKYRSWMFIKE
jgi:hypothetical protein